MKQLYNMCLIAVLALTTTGCNKFDDDINIDPNNPEKASATQLIASAQQSLPDIGSAFDKNASPYGIHYPQYISGTTFTDNSRYNTVNFNFYPIYAGPLMNLTEAIKVANNPNEGPIANQIAVAKIMKAYYFWHVTDRWGLVPYSEAFQGRADFTPKYDTQQQIYNDLFKLLDEANAAFVAGNIKNDIIYGGDMVKWKKLGNTIHLLMALRLSKVDPVKGADEFKKSLANGIMEKNEDNFTYVHLVDKVNENFWYTSFGRLKRNWFAVSKTVVDYMQPLNDPRLPVFADKNVAGNYVGLEYGLPGSVSVVINNISLLGSALRQQNSPTYLVTYAQALFAKAEAAKLGWIPGGDGDAKVNYDKAIEQSILQWTKSAGSAATFIAQPQVAYNPATGLRQIAEQRWIHLFMHGYEGWAEWRRTGYPLLNPAPNNNNLAIPRREGYPTQEISNNGPNYSAAVAAFPYGGADDLNARVWWDKP
ncbi:SusD/RagB family nutrient-binding outer membrane lipoprotein [Pedobacter sp. KBW06]|uniref:SusD/RagB family nutrient-binding outer membrane lipoprotein n=1 Tax=Pedobacter sp. KBW06 TaxID=2153359 RepID=UPI000F59FD2B|nr:SusD/RagB family nutrient-binding outer membrane lipoprotein [Pedobacter sp. KBW06]RQO74245.1 SusD/RagB family nutrient-binding outer membrane lipoprotein [Pedobacter sp. KBW06]